MVKIRKMIIPLVVWVLLMVSCKDGTKARAHGVSVATEEKVTARDRSIDMHNAFNSIFLDSAAISHFIVAEQLSDTMANAIRDFYNARNFEFAWFSGRGLIEQSFSFRSLYTSEVDNDPVNKSLEQRLDRLRAAEPDSINARDASIVKTELQITERFIQYAQKNYANLGISPTSLGTYIPAKKREILAWADSVLVDNEVNKTYASLNEQYKLLKAPLRQYRTLARKGGWPIIASDVKKLKLGDRGQGIRQIKMRLAMTGELVGSDTDEVFSPALATAVKQYQSNHGFRETGIVTEELRKDLNITALARVGQLLMNMQRMRWMPTSPSGTLIIVNIPEFVVRVDSDKTELFRMDVVVGREGHNTTMFSGKLNQVVFSPYWNVPASIVKKEVVPGLRRDRNYLRRRNMEIKGRTGGLPVVRQRPGPRNALGKVKFLFPNSFDIYMHDTPEKGLFDRTERGLSHGCIRLSDAPKMANYLLRHAPEWSPEKIDIAMNSKKEQFVALKEHVPVIITYYTAWVDNKGILHYADDIYGHDQQMAQKMFLNPQ